MKIITTIVAAFQIVSTMVPMIRDLVSHFEMPGATGSDKKQAVMDVLKAALDALPVMGIVDLPVTIILTIASSVIDAIVAGNNLLGVFNHKKAGS